MRPCLSVQLCERSKRGTPGDSASIAERGTRPDLRDYVFVAEHSLLNLIPGRRPVSGRDFRSVVGRRRYVKSRRPAEAGRSEPCGMDARTRTMPAYRPLRRSPGFKFARHWSNSVSRIERRPSTRTKAGAAPRFAFP